MLFRNTYTFLVVCTSVSTTVKSKSLVLCEQTSRFLATKNGETTSVVRIAHPSDKSKLKTFNVSRKILSNVSRKRQ